MNELEAFRGAVRRALEPFEDVAFAFLFGSVVSGRLRDFPYAISVQRFDEMYIKSFNHLTK